MRIIPTSETRLDGTTRVSYHILNDIPASVIGQIKNECRSAEEIELDDIVAEFTTNAVKRIEEASPVVGGDHSKWIFTKSKLEGLAKDGHLKPEEVEFIEQNRTAKQTVDYLKNAQKDSVKDVARVLKSERFRMVDNHATVLPKYYDKFVHDVEKLPIQSLSGEGEFLLDSNVMTSHPKEVEAFEKLYKKEVKNWYDMVPGWQKLEVMYQVTEFAHLNLLNGYMGFFSNAFGLPVNQLFGIMEIQARSEASPKSNYKKPAEFLDLDSWLKQAVKLHGQI